MVKTIDLFKQIIENQGFLLDLYEEMKDDMTELKDQFTEIMELQGSLHSDGTGMNELVKGLVDVMASFEEEEEQEEFEDFDDDEFIDFSEFEEDA